MMKPSSYHHFRVWAPEKQRMELQLISPVSRKIPLTKTADGYFEAEVDDCPPNAQYRYRPDDEGDFPDPRSHYQPDGVHGPSQLVRHDQFPWTDSDWRGYPLSQLILYEIHVGTFTETGTFEAIIPRLDDLLATGINAIEIMPVAQFPGNRNWGYDGVFPYAVQHSYGGPDGLKKLVDACHNRGISVVLDVVYNHLGPEGNYVGHFGPYFTDNYRTPWGMAVNFDGPYADGVRDFFIENALHWFQHYHIDGLRLDAIHAIFDHGAVHFLQQINQEVKAYAEQVGKPLFMIAESDLNAPRVIQHEKIGGYGFDAQWLDDFHHALFVKLYPEGKSRYEDFGDIRQLAKAYTDGFVHSGEYVVARKRKYGSSSAGIPGHKFVAFIQNHDQIGNHKNGARLSTLVDAATLRIAAAALLLSPYIPMLFMGEEYGEDNPFLYFTSHSDPELAKLVQEGRKQEFKHFMNGGDPPDPQSESTFSRSILDWEKRKRGKYAETLLWYHRLIMLRRTHPALQNDHKTDMQVNVVNDNVWELLRQDETGQFQLLSLFNLADTPYSLKPPQNKAGWVYLMDSQSFNGKAMTAERTVLSDEQIVLPPKSAVILSGKKTTYS